MTRPDDGPALPPSPLTPDHAVPRPGAALGPPLSWLTIPLTAAAGGLSGLFWRAAYAGLTTWERVGFIALGSTLGGLGLCLVDRVWRHRPRALRWALGTAGGTLLPFAFQVGVFRTYLTRTYWYPAPVGMGALGLSVPTVFSLLAFAAIGLIFGLLAAQPGARWRIPLAGFVLPWVRAIPAWNGLGLPWGYCDLLSLGGSAGGTLDTCAAAGDSMFGLLLGLAVAVGDWLAVRGAEGAR